MQNKKWQLVVLAVLVLLTAAAGGFWWMQQQAASPAPLRPVRKAAPATSPETAGQSAARPAADAGIAVPPITELNPRTAYSGNLGTLTGIQAGADIKKMELEYAQLDAKIRDLQKKEDIAPLLPPLAQAPGVPGLPRQEPSRVVVMAVRGADGALSATLRTKNGTHIVRVGESVPGFGKVQLISRDRVVVGGSPVPWK